MDRNPPPRRWYQFRLSTILVLVAIAAWAMSIRPWWGTMERRVSHDEFMAIWREEPWASTRLPKTIMADESGVIPYFVYERGPRPAIVWPLLTLLAFLAWKLGWVIAARKGNRERAT